MTDHSRLDKALRGFKGTIEAYGRQKYIYVDDEKIIISYDRIGIGMTVLFLTILVILPVCILIYFVLIADANSTILLALLVIAWVAFEANKTIKVSNISTINIKSRYIKTEKPNKFLIRFFPPQQVAFSDIVSVDLMDVKINPESVNSWKLLSVTDINKKKVVLNEFNGNFPDGLIASQVKLIIEVIIWGERQKEN